MARSSDESTAGRSAPVTGQARVGRPRRNSRPLSRPADEEILYQAGKLFCEKGFAGTSTRDIAEAAGLQQSSLFHYFRTKEAILVALSERALVKPLMTLDQIRAEDGTPVEHLYRIVYTHVEHLLSRPVDLIAVFFSPMELPRSRFRRYLSDLDRYVDGIAEVIQSGIDGGDFIDGDARLEALRILGMCNVRTLRWYWKTGNLSEREIADDFARTALRSLVEDPASLKQLPAVKPSPRGRGRTTSRSTA
jgi:AcrR family transcriptional regulator